MPSLNSERQQDPDRERHRARMASVVARTHGAANHLRHVRQLECPGDSRHGACAITVASAWRRQGPFRMADMSHRFDMARWLPRARLQCRRDADLTIGLAATTTVFSAVNAILPRPLPYVQPDRLVSLSHTLGSAWTLRADQSDASLLFTRDTTGVLAFGGYRTAAVALGPAGGADAERVLSRSSPPVSCGRRALRGRLPPRSTIGSSWRRRSRSSPERLWRRNGSDPALLNRRLEIDGVAHDVIGIVPAAAVSAATPAVAAAAARSGAHRFGHVRLPPWPGSRRHVLDQAAADPPRCSAGGEFPPDDA